MPRLLDVRDLSVHYGASQALHSVSLAVPDGALVGLLGPNGAGKSTLLRTIAGLAKPTTGEIELAGRRIDGRPAHDIAALGVCLVPEGRGIFPALTVDENLRIFLGDDTAAVFERFPALRGRGPQLAGTLSGGEQQMLALARAAGPTKLLMMDEPSLGLAPRLVNMVADTLADLHERDGRTILLVEQYASHVVRLADVIYVLSRGTIAWAGEPDELRASRVLAESYLGER